MSREQTVVVLLAFVAAVGAACVPVHNLLADRDPSRTAGGACACVVRVLVSRVGFEPTT